MIRSSRPADLDLAEEAPWNDEFYRVLLQDMPDMICRWRPDGIFTFVNDRLCEYFASTPEELLGRSFLSMVPPTDAERLQRLLKNLGRDTPVGTLEYEAVSPDGTSRWQEWLTRCLFDAAGNVAGFQSTGRDITQRKHSDASRLMEFRRHQLQREVLNEVVESDALMSGDVEALARQVTEAGARALGTARANAWLFNEDESELRCIDLFEAGSGRHSAGLVLKERQFATEFRALKLARYVDAHDPLTDPRTAGYVEGYLKPLGITSMLDVVIQLSGRHMGVLCFEHVNQAHLWQADEIAFASQLADKLGLCIAHRERLGVTRELHEAQRVAQMGNWHLNVATGSISWSDEVCRIFGRDPASFTPTLAALANLMTPASFARLEEALAECQRSGMAYTLDVEAVLPSGERRWVACVGEPVREAGGAISAVRGTAQDITDRLAMEEQLQRAQRMESIGQLTGGIAHDFNNLLTVVMGNAELLHDALAGDARLGPMAEMIVQGAQRGAELTHRLLAYARRQALNPEVANLDGVITGMQGMLHRTLGDHIEVQVACAPNLWPAMVDVAQLENALLNLAINARDAMPEGGKLVIEARNVELDAELAVLERDVQPGDYVQVSVSDSGCGISPENLARVVEPFFTTKEAGKGTGLGLAMVYGFSKQSNGYLKMYSELGEGTSVHLYLPRPAGDAKQVRAANRPVASDGGSELVLLVEDDEMVRVYAESQLTMLGYRVVSTSNGPEALEVIRARDDIDLLFTDVVMPGGMNGRALAEAARALRPDMKVLYTSGYTENAIMHHGRLEPDVHLLGKPYRRSELALKIRTALAAEPAGI